MMKIKIAINVKYGGFSLSEKAINRLKELGMDIDSKYYFSDNTNIELRSNPLLIQVLEELKEEANGDCSDIKIKVIEFDPFDRFEIKEYDGKESLWITDVKTHLVE